MIHQLRQSIVMRWIGELALPPGAQVLEIGCGAGRAAVALAQRGFQVHATDPVPAMLDRARSNVTAAGVGERVTFGTADAQALQLPSESVDLVLALGVVPWISSPARALAEMVRVSRAGGIVAVNMDNASRLNYALDPKLNRHLAPMRAALKRLLRRGPSRAGPRSELHSIREFDAMLHAARLEKLRGQTIGFGPFTVLGHRALPERLGVQLHRSLQRRADRGVGALAARGAQYLVLARAASELGATAP